MSILGGRALPSKVCPAKGLSSVSGYVVHPCREVIYSNSRVHGNRTLGVVSGLSNYFNWILNKTRHYNQVIDAGDSLSRWESRKDLWA